MFIVARRLGDRIVIGDCRVTVVKIARNDVGLGIEDPLDAPGPTVGRGPHESRRAASVMGPETGKRHLFGMRYVSRRTGGTVVIGSCRVTVIETHAHLVRLGVNAPADVLVRRDG